MGSLKHHHYVFFWNIAGLDLGQFKAQNTSKPRRNRVHILRNAVEKRAVMMSCIKGKPRAVHFKRQHPSVITLAPLLCSGVVAKQGRRRPLERLG